MIRAWAMMVLAGVLLAGFSAGCAREDPHAPPDLVYGHSACAVCHMILSDERYAAAISVVDERGRVQKPAFDDIGCLFEYEAANPGVDILARHIRAADSSGWLDARTAPYVHSEAIVTPMAFGLAACADRGSAEALRERVGGEVIDFEEARRRTEGGPAAWFQGRADPGSAVRRVLPLDGGREVRVELASPPAAVAPGSHRFEVAVAERGPGGQWRASDRFTLKIEPFMPSMNHGSPGNRHPAPAGEGRMEGLVNFTMPGAWEVRVDVLEGQESLGRVVFEFTVSR